MYWYQWRGKRCHIYSKIAQYDKIRKQHKLIIHGSRNFSKLSLDKENFFELDSLPKNSSFWRYLKKDGEFISTVNFKDLIQDATFENIKSRGKQLNDYVELHYKAIKEEEIALQKQEKANEALALAAGPTATIKVVQPPLSEIMQDVEEITGVKMRKDF